MHSPSTPTAAMVAPLSSGDTMHPTATTDTAAPTYYPSLPGGRVPTLQDIVSAGGDNANAARACQLNNTFYYEHVSLIVRLELLRTLGVSLGEPQSFPMGGVRENQAIGDLWLTPSIDADPWRRNNTRNGHNHSEAAAALENTIAEESATTTETMDNIMANLLGSHQT